MMITNALHMITVVRKDVLRILVCEATLFTHRVPFGILTLSLFYHSLLFLFLSTISHLPFLLNTDKNIIEFDKLLVLYFNQFDPLINMKTRRGDQRIDHQKEFITS